MMIVFIEIHVISVRNRTDNAHYAHSTHKPQKGSMKQQFF